MNKLSSVLLIILTVSCTDKQADKAINVAKKFLAKNFISYPFTGTFYSTSEKKIFKISNKGSIKMFNVKPFTLFSVVKVATNKKMVWFGLNPIDYKTNEQPRLWINKGQLLPWKKKYCKKRISQLKGDFFFDKKKKNLLFFEKKYLNMYLVRYDSYHPFNEKTPDYRLYRIMSMIIAVTNKKGYFKIIASGLLSQEEWLSARSETVANHMLKRYDSSRPIVVKHYGDYVVIPALNLKLYRGQYKKKKTK